MNIQRILKYIGLLILVVLIALLLYWALINGKKAGQSRQIVKDTRTIQAALELFYKDQDRYPSIDEFNDQNLLRSYMDNFPPRQFPSSNCPRSYEYVNTFRSDYELRICWPKGISGYKTGWNIVKSPVK